MLASEEGGIAYVPGTDAPDMRFVLNILECYGIRRFLADIDSRRDYWREGETLVHSSLDWLATEGFEQLFAQFGGTLADAQEFRDRYVIRALTQKKRPRW